MISHRRFLYSAGLFTTLLLCWLPAIAQTSAPKTAKPGTISGRVVNQTGRPLPNARVVLRRIGSMGPGSINATTDIEGKFEVSELKPWRYQVSAYLEGYTQILGALDDTQAGVYSPGDFVTLVLTKGGVITGTVTNQAGEPVAGVNVRTQMVANLTSSNNLFHIPNLFRFSSNPTDLTDDRGIYRIYGLLEETYVVWAGGGGGELPYSTNADPFGSDVPTYAPASTRDTAQQFMVRAGTEATGVDIQYRGGSGHAVSGSARGPDGNQPLGFGIFIVSANGPYWMTRASQGPDERSFMFEGVDDGDYSITAISQSPKDELLSSAPKQITVRGADVSGVELVVQPLSSVAGRVVLEETKTTECSDKQRPVFDETLVSAQTNTFNTSRPNAWFGWSVANPDERGNILLKNLASGRYSFSTQYFAKDWYLKSISVLPPETATVKVGKPIDAARTWTTLKPGDRLSGLTITIAQGAASLRGHIALNKGETLEEKLYVYLVPAERETADDPLRFYGVAVTAEGKVALNNLAPGRYWVLAQEAMDDSAPTLTRLRSPDDKAYRMKMRREAETLKAEIELKPCQTIADLKVHVRTN